MNQRARSMACLDPFPLVLRDRDDAVKRRDIAAIYLTTDQIAEAQRLAREWTAKHGKK